MPKRIPSDSEIINFDAKIRPRKMHADVVIESEILTTLLMTKYGSPTYKNVDEFKKNFGATKDAVEGYLKGLGITLEQLMDSAVDLYGSTLKLESLPNDFHGKAYFLRITADLKQAVAEFIGQESVAACEAEVKAETEVKVVEEAKEDTPTTKTSSFWQNFRRRQDSRRDQGTQP